MIIVGVWLGYAALGAGLIHLALAVTAPLALAMALIVIALAELAWAVWVFISSRLPAPSWALALALAPVTLWILLLVLPDTQPWPSLEQPRPFFPFALATVFNLGIAVVIALSRHHLAHSAHKPGVIRYLLAVCGGAVLLATATTPALNASYSGPGENNGRVAVVHQH